jgi:hypothetical protein
MTRITSQLRASAPSFVPSAVSGARDLDENRSILSVKKDVTWLILIIGLTTPLIAQNKELALFTELSQHRDMCLCRVSGMQFYLRPKARAREKAGKAGENSLIGEQ